MKISVFSTKSYDQDYFEKYKGHYDFEISYFETALDQDTVNLAVKSEVVYVFVNDDLNENTIAALHNKGVKTKTWHVASAHFHHGRSNYWCGYVL
ncbi:MAG: hypothetical protein WBG46_00360 [Nonlabens sp.]